MPELVPSLLRPWIRSHVSRVNLPNKETYCLSEEVPVAGCLIQYFPFWEEVIQADRWVLEVICQGYSMKLFQTPTNTGIKNAQPPPAGQYVLSKEVEGLLYGAGAGLQTSHWPLQEGWQQIAQAGMLSALFVVASHT